MSDKQEAIADTYFFFCQMRYFFAFLFDFLLYFCFVLRAMGRLLHPFVDRNGW